MKKSTASVILFLLFVSTSAIADFAPHTRIQWVVKLKNERPFKRLKTQYAVPTFVDNIIYVGSASGHIYAIDRLRGRKIWRSEVRGPVYGGIAYQDNTLYFGDGKGFVYAMDATAGKELWHAEMGSDIMCTPLVSGNMVFFTTMSGHLLAIDRTTGGRIYQTLRRTSTGEFSVRGSSSPVQWQNLIIAGFSDGTLVAFDQASGSKVWEYTLGNMAQPMQDVDGTPLLIGDVVIAASINGSLAAIQAKTGQVQWSAPIDSPNDVIYEDGVLYAEGKGKLYALNPTTGSIIWKQRLDTAEASTPARINGTIFDISTHDKSYWVNDSSGEIIHTRFIGKGSFSKPLVVGTTLYVLTNRGDLYALETK
ncbi:MAG: hypothetical protein COV45_05450 [Deltaproteobacteria bacterium CG11_big_fil_rev_8_21_14_0_20_47_16]|nr:MAG: hypothetical protein COV45_05450 [Deltaproteobacteria bacterium CG11_big_fil_rev_8_21_14_0_20_47_16]